MEVGEGGRRRDGRSRGGRGLGTRRLRRASALNVPAAPGRTGFRFEKVGRLAVLTLFLHVLCGSAGVRVQHFLLRGREPRGESRSGSRLELAAGSAGQPRHQGTPGREGAARVPARAPGVLRDSPAPCVGSRPLHS